MAFIKLSVLYIKYFFWVYEKMIKMRENLINKWKAKQMWVNCIVWQLMVDSFAVNSEPVETGIVVVAVIWKYD